MPVAASPSSALTLGLGSWGSIGLLITLGFGSGEAPPEPEPVGDRLDDRIVIAQNRISFARRVSYPLRSIQQPDS